MAHQPSTTLSNSAPRTVLSVNLNKIALLRNSRGRNFPSVIQFAKRSIQQGVRGITIHPRPDERHIRRQDARDLAVLLREYPEVELNIEGYPSDEFIDLVNETTPDQVTLVPDTVEQITSDHGWDLTHNFDALEQAAASLRDAAGRIAVFVDPGAQLHNLPGVCDRVELYTQAYAEAFASQNQEELATVLQLYASSIAQAQQSGLGINAGHDLDLKNLPTFLALGGIQEVSIGHALTVEALEFGWDQVLHQYLQICK